MQIARLPNLVIRSQTHLNRLSVAVFDMKGITYSQVPDHVTQIGYVSIIGGDIAKGEAHHWFVNPGNNVKIPPMISYLNYLSEYKIRNARLLDEVLLEFKLRATGKVLVTHNIKRFSVRILQSLEGITSTREITLIDTCQITKKLRPNLNSFTLKESANAFGVPLHNCLLHNAMEDTRVTAALLLKQFEELESLGIETLDQLNKFCQA